MPSFSKRSRERLQTCHPDLQEIFNEVIKHFDCSVLCGFRTKEEQNEWYAKGTSKLPWPKSKHNKAPSLAVDVAPYPYNPRDIDRFYFFAGIVIQTATTLLKDKRISHAIRWGGDWDGDTDLKDNRFNDLAHFELITDGRVPSFLKHYI